MCNRLVLSCLCLCTPPQLYLCCYIILTSLHLCCIYKPKSIPFISSTIPTNTPRRFHVETTWKRPFPCRFNLESTWYVCRHSQPHSFYWSWPITFIFTIFGHTHVTLSFFHDKSINGNILLKYTHSWADIDTYPSKSNFADIIKRS